MGLLDDAIREHLELKRRRGADPGEVAREQREALDAVPHEAARAGEDTPAAEEAAPISERPALVVEEAAPPEPPVGAPGVAPVGAVPVADDLVQSPHPRVGAVKADAGETAELDMQSVLGQDEQAPSRESAPAAPAAAERMQSAAESAPVEEDSLEWEVPGEVAEEPEVGESAEDVLEETPDFLRDTPEQERLWFEQRPPRDFDFDK